MGLETAAIVMATVAVGAEIGKAVTQDIAADQKTQALNLQAKQLEIQRQEKTLSNYDVMEKVLQAQEAYMTVSGTSFSSPSFNAIQRNTVNIGAKKQKNTDIEGEFSRENIDIEKENVKNTLYAQLFGDVAETAMTAFSVATHMPSKTPTLNPSA